MRRYERLPPIHSQFSIDSDSDMTESSGLIQEYDVFDPNRERPKIIFVIGELYCNIESFLHLLINTVT